jgi:hypothetical protein
MQASLMCCAAPACALALICQNLQAHQRKTPCGSRRASQLHLFSLVAHIIKAIHLWVPAYHAHTSVGGSTAAVRNDGSSRHHSWPAGHWVQFHTWQHDA